MGRLRGRPRDGRAAGGRGGRRRRHDRGDRRGWPAARHGRARRRRSVGPSREALERHRIGSRRRLVDQAVRWWRRRAGRLGGRGGQRAGGLTHRDEAVLVAPFASGRMGAHRPHRPAARLRHVQDDRPVHDRSWRRFRHGLLVAGDGGLRRRSPRVDRPGSRLERGPPHGCRTVRTGRHVPWGRRRTRHR